MHKCGGVIDETTTREELLARGFTEEGADEVLAFRERLRLKGLKDIATHVQFTPGGSNAN